MDSALDGVRVVDLSSGIAGPLAAMLLADFGADVVRVESSCAAPDRARAGFAMFNRNKRSLVLDPHSEEARTDLRTALAGADVCVAGPVAESVFAADIDRATREDRSLIYVQMPPYLDDTPWSGGVESNALLSAALGTSLRQSSFDGGPVDPVYPHFLYVQAVWGACAAVAALLERHASGHGQTVTVGGVHGAMVTMPLQFLLTPGMNQSDTAVGPGGPSPLYSRYRCADGAWLFLAALTPKFQRAALDVLGLSELLTRDGVDGDLETLLAHDNRPMLRERLRQTFATRTCADWQASFKAADCPVAALGSRDDWLDHPQIKAIDMAVTVTDPERGGVTMPGNPIWLTATPATVDRPAPRPGEGAERVTHWTPRTVPSGTAPQRPGPLAGYRVLDLGMVLAGPYTGTLLAELGADVIKVEVPTGDSWRERGFIYIRGQRGLALDLRSEEGREVFDQLVRDADVVVDNYRPGVLERLGIEHERLLHLNPALVALSITAFGVGGPMGGEAGFDPLLQAMSGVMAAQGGDSEPVLLTAAINDVTVAALTALAACIALMYRERTGNGQSGWTSLAGTATFIQCEELIRMAGRTAAPVGGRDFPGPGALDRFYATADGWVRLHAVRADAAALERLVAPAAGRFPESADETVQVLQRFFAGRTQRAALAELADAGVPAAPTRPMTELPDDPRLRRWDVFHRLPRPDQSSLYATGRSVRFSRTPNDAVLLAPGVGEHTTEILHELGLGDETIDELRNRGVVRQGEPMVPRSFGAYR